MSDSTENILKFINNFKRREAFNNIREIYLNKKHKCIICNKQNNLLFLPECKINTTICLKCAHPHKIFMLKFKKSG